MDTIGRYEVLGRIGSGGFATVFRVRDPVLDSEVAVKVLADNWAGDPQIRERFIREAQILRRIDSDRVITVHDIGELPNGQPYFVMALADRGTLEGRLEPGRPPTLDDVAAIARGMADCVTVVHSHGLIHRDIKPSNLLIAGPRSGGSPEAPTGLLAPTERLVLGDFGLAKDIEFHNTGVTISAGSGGYAAPEQMALAGSPSRRTDLYAATAVMYRVLTGTRPPSFDLARRIVPFPDHEWWMAGTLGRFFLQGMSYEPEGRHDSIDHWLAEFTAAMAAFGTTGGGAQAATVAVAVLPPAPPVSGPPVSGLPASGPPASGPPAHPLSVPVVPAQHDPTSVIPLARDASTLVPPDEASPPFTAEPADAGRRFESGRSHRHDPQDRAHTGEPQSGTWQPVHRSQPPVDQAPYPQAPDSQASYPGRYPQTGYSQTGYPQTGYPQTGYPQTGYPPAQYPQPHHQQPPYPPPRARSRRWVLGGLVTVAAAGGGAVGWYLLRPQGPVITGPDQITAGEIVSYRAELAGATRYEWVDPAGTVQPGQELNVRGIVPGTIRISAVALTNGTRSAASTQRILVTASPNSPVIEGPDEIVLNRTETYGFRAADGWRDPVWRNPAGVEKSGERYEVTPTAAGTFRITLIITTAAGIRLGATKDILFVEG